MGNDQHCNNCRHRPNCPSGAPRRAECVPRLVRSGWEADEDERERNRLFTSEGRSK